jgi:glucose-6-phosphate isomerase
MSSLFFSSSYADAYLASKNVSFSISLPDAHISLQNKTCFGSDFLGWVDLPTTIQSSLVDIQQSADSLRTMSDVLIVCGIGGSYLGARALIEALQVSPLTIEIVFLGNHLSGSEYEKVFQKYAQKRVSVCIISKSGTTLETAISYRLVRAFLLSKYSESEVKERIVTITDAAHGALRTETIKQGYKSYILPGDIGGRYSVLTAVGLLPIAVAGIDIVALVDGARRAQEEIQNDGSLSTHPTFLYAEKRVQLEISGFVSELFITPEPSLYFIGEWWKQLMGESHGKEGKGLYPDTLSYTTDLHSLGQYVQEGRRLFFETMLWIEKSSSDLTIPAMPDMTDGLDSLVGRSLHEMNLIALESTAKAHNDGGCPSMMITLEKLDAHNLGYFLYSMMYACALSGIMIGVNPFDQPGVEAYKTEMRKRM